MDLIGKNIRFLRENSGFTQKTLASKIGITRSMIGAYEEGRSTPLIDIALRIADLFEVDINTFLRVDLSKKHGKNFYSRGRDILAITIDSENQENIELVSHKASAGYVTGYHDLDFVKELPKLSLPFLSRQLTYRAFEISGDSMLPVKPGSIVIGEFLDNLLDLKSGDLCIVVTKSDGIIYKRVYNFLEKCGQLLMVSDNLIYDPYLINSDQILQIWRQRKIISDDLRDVQAMSLSKEQLATMIFNSQSLLESVNSNGKSIVRKSAK